MSLLRPMEISYRDWGDADMRFSNDFRNTTGFILDEDEPVGTFFLVQFAAGPPDAGIRLNSKFLVTARHVLEDVRSPKVRYRGAQPGGRITGEVHEWDVPKWHRPSDENTDLAVSPFNPPTPAAVVALPVEFATSHVGRPVELGEPVFKVGLWSPSADTSRYAVPLVRSGTVAALEERDIRWDDDGGRSGVWPYAHLIDIKSKEGMSGGPVFIQRYVARDWIGPIPEPWLVRARNFGTTNLHEVATFTDWWGLFVGHADDTGIGVVLPVETIMEFFETELGALMQEESERRWNERPNRGAPRPTKRDRARQTSTNEEFDRFEDLTGNLLAVPKKELDEQRNREDS